MIYIQNNFVPGILIREKPKQNKMKIENLSLAEIVTAKPEAAALLENYNLDFCCGGKQKLSEALKNDADKLKEVTAQLENIFEKVTATETDFNKMSLTDLSHYIINKHHKYVIENLPVIQQHLEKVATKHGEQYPEMKKVKMLFDEIKRDFEQHMMKEEVILFPRIKQLEEAFNNGTSLETLQLQSPINVMLYEHDSAHKLTEEIKKLTNNYTAPENACTTFRVALDELKIFESDLHQHVHLENNILFPKALRMQEELSLKMLN